MSINGGGLGKRIKVMSEKKEKCLFLYFVDLERQSPLPTYPSGIKIT